MVPCRWGIVGYSPSGEIIILNLKRPRTCHYQHYLFSVGSMSNLPKRLAPLHSAGALSLLPHLHTNSLYSEDDIATVLNSMVDVERDNARRLDVTLRPQTRICQQRRK